MTTNRIVIQDKARKMCSQYNSDELWDRYKNAKLMDDKEEVAIFRAAIKLCTGQVAR